MPFDSVNFAPDVQPSVEDLSPERQALYRAGMFFLEHPEGHCKGSLVKYRDGRVMLSDPREGIVAFCAIGRIAYESGRDFNGGPSPVFDAASLLLRRDLSVKDLIFWNDRPERTPQEVGRAMVAAALTPSPGRQP